MKNYSKIYAVIAFLYSTARMIAQPGDNSDLNDMEGADNQMPISDYLWVLAIVGLVFVYFKLRSAHLRSIEEED